MRETELILEIGSQAYSDLTDSEITSLTSSFDSTQASQAGMKAFDLLRKKFQLSYRMGRTRKELSDKYVFYDRIYKEYANNVSAGSTTGTTTSRDKHKNVDRYKFSNAN